MLKPFRLNPIQFSSRHIHHPRVVSFISRRKFANNCTILWKLKCRKCSAFPGNNYRAERNRFCGNEIRNDDNTLSTRYNNPSLQRIITSIKYPINFTLYIIYLSRKNTLSTFRIYLYKHDITLTCPKWNFRREGFQILSIGEHGSTTCATEILQINFHRVSNLSIHVSRLRKLAI